MAPRDLARWKKTLPASRGEAGAVIRGYGAAHQSLAIDTGHLGSDVIRAGEIDDKTEFFSGTAGKT